MKIGDLARSLVTKGYDHSKYITRPEYTAALQAIDMLIKTEEDGWEPEDAYRLPAEMTFILPYLDCCARCQAAGDSRSVYPPSRTEIKGAWMTGWYRCKHRHAWTCGWRIPDLAEFKVFAKRAPRLAKEEVTACYLCLEPLTDPIEMDHVLPKSRGGIDGLIMPTHQACNRAKSNKPLMQRPDW